MLRWGLADMASWERRVAVRVVGDEMIVSRLAVTARGASAQRLLERHATAAWASSHRDDRIAQAAKPATDSRR